MANPEHVDVVKSGAKAIKTWRVQNPETTLNLYEASLSGVDLRGANLIDAELSGADLSEADLTGAYLSGAKLTDARLRRARLHRARLIGSRVARTDFTQANLTKANLRHAAAAQAVFAEANMAGVKIRAADLHGARFPKANLTGARLVDLVFEKAELAGALVGWTIFAACDLSGAVGLEELEHRGPSTIGTDTLRASQGRLPDSLLRGAGLAPWETRAARLYDATLGEPEVRRLVDEVLRLRAEAPAPACGVFISYDQADRDFAEKLHARFLAAGWNCWKDPHDATATGLHLRLTQSQVERVLGERDVIVLVISRNSTASSWLDHELDAGRRRERELGRDILFPVALDDAWQEKMTDTSWKTRLEDLLWRHNKAQLVVDFRNWTQDEFETQCQTLLAALSEPR